MKYEMKEGIELTVEEGEQSIRDRTKIFALRIIRLNTSLPKSTEAQVIGKQILRSGTSVGANYREASRSRSDTEFIAKFGVCLQELDETSYWLELLTEAQIVPNSKLANLIDETNQLLAIFTSISKKMKTRK